MKIEDLATQVVALREECKLQILAIRKLYKTALRARELPIEFQPKIKNILENQRSMLDYIAHFTVENFGHSGRRSQYPLALDKGLIQESIAKNLAGVVDTDLVDFFAKRQPCVPEYAWLVPLIEETNSFKHRKFVTQVRTEQHRITSTSEGGSVSWVPGSVNFGEGVFIHGNRVDPATQLPVGGNVTKEILVGWNFDGTQTNVLGAILALQEGLTILSEDFITLVSNRT